MRRLFRFCFRREPLLDVSLLFELFKDIPTADEIYDGEKNVEKVWVLLKAIFDIFAMHDVNLLMPKIIKWLCQSLDYFSFTQRGEGSKALLGEYPKAEDLYNGFKTGLPLACILYLYVDDEQL